MRFLTTIHLLPVLDSVFSLLVAFVLGTLVGIERQFRQRSAGLRTNTLVAVGAAAFVDIGQRLAGDAEAVRVISYVVSGIGFLGAGIIFRDGFEVHGLNTAATLWCSAGVGLLAASGDWRFALLLTALVVFVNLGLRPLVRLLKRHTTAGSPVQKTWRVTLGCAPEAEGPVRALILRTFSLSGLELVEIESRRSETGIELSAAAHGEGITDAVLSQTLQRLAVEPQVQRLTWEAAEEEG